MSVETVAWAKQQRTGNPVTRAVLNELCNWAKPTGSVEFLALDAIALAVEVSPRTVQRHLDRLEMKLRLIRKIERFRPDGGRSANGFELVGYSMADWQRAKAPTPPRQDVSHPIDKVTPTPRQIVREPHDNCVVGLGDKILTPIPPDGGIAPRDENQEGSGVNPGAGLSAAPKPQPDQRGTRLPKDWTPPPIADLPPQARHFAEQWPSGAYEAICEQFALFWWSQPGAKGRKLDWLATLGKWIGNDHSRVMRDAKAGVSFAAPATAAPQITREKAREHFEAALGRARGGSGSDFDYAKALAKRHGFEMPEIDMTPAWQLPSSPPSAKRLEDERSRAIHAAVQRRVSPQVYSRWIEHLAIIVEAHGGVTVHVRGVGPGRAVEERYAHEIEAAARTILTRAFAGLRFEFEAISLKSTPEKDEDRP